MAAYTIGFSTTNTGSGAPCAEFIAAATSKPKLLELTLVQQTAPAAAAVYGFGRPAAVGVNPTIVKALDEQDGNGPTGLPMIAIAWGTAPTVPANFNRRTSRNTTAGDGVTWIFPRGFGLPAGGSAVLWALSTVVTLDVTVVFEG